jgi:predicted phosphoadenosine phosphosulfate sulfurtransferase
LAPLNSGAHCGQDQNSYDVMAEFSKWLEARRGEHLLLGNRESEEIQRAIAMTKNLREQELLANRLKQLEKAAFSV